LQWCEHNNPNDDRCEREAILECSLGLAYRSNASPMIFSKKFVIKVEEAVVSI